MYNKDRYVVRSLGWSGYTVNIYPMDENTLEVFTQIFDEEGDCSADVYFPGCDIKNIHGFTPDDILDIRESLYEYSKLVFTESLSLARGESNG